MSAKPPETSVIAPFYEKPVHHRLVLPQGIVVGGRWRSFRESVFEACRLVSRAQLGLGHYQCLSPRFSGNTLVLEWESSSLGISAEQLALRRHTFNKLSLFSPPQDLMVRFAVIISCILCPDRENTTMQLGGDRSGWIVAAELARTIYGWRVPALSLIGQFPDNDIDGHLMAFYFPSARFPPLLKGAFIRGSGRSPWLF